MINKINQLKDLESIRLFLDGLDYFKNKNLIMGWNYSEKKPTSQSYFKI